MEMKEILTEAKELEKNLNEIRKHIEVIKNACPYFAAGKDETLEPKKVLIDCKAKEYQTALEPYREAFVGEDEKSGIHTWRFHLGRIYEIGEKIAEEYFKLENPKYRLFLPPSYVSFLKTPIACTGSCGEFVKNIKNLERITDFGLTMIEIYRRKIRT